MYYLLGTRTGVQHELCRKENLNSKITNNKGKYPPWTQRNNPKPQDPLVWAQPHTSHIKQKRRHGEKVRKRPCPCTQPKDCSLLVSCRRPQGSMESDRGLRP